MTRVSGNGLLHGLRVVDLTDESGQLAGRALADLGADVVLVEPEGGTPTRGLAPRDATSGESLRFASLNAGKRAASDADAAALIAGADVVLANRGPRDGEAPDAVWVAITPFGLEGPKDVPDRRPRPRTGPLHRADGVRAWRR
jgi:hypothetical protein